MQKPVTRKTKEQLPPLRDFHGIRVSQSTLKSIFKKNKTSEDITKAIFSSESDLKICCSPHDKTGKSIKLDCDDIYDRSNHDRSFLFKTWKGQAIILEIHHFGKWEEYEFCEAIHAGWVPEVEKISLKKDEQKKAFKIFKELLADTEQINGFSIMDKSHRINSQPEFRSLLIRILNSNQFKEV